MSSKIHRGDEVHERLSNKSYRDGVVTIEDAPTWRRSAAGNFLIEVDGKTLDVHPLTEDIDGPFIGWGIRFEV